jgi:hypothetical protein
MESPYLNEDTPLITFEELNEAKEQATKLKTEIKVL